ncbi:MAG TPA: SDR family NAD(P)-dependent oxidoreductase [Candidatus Thermoplasmatota archaeon]|nr:SDR family NAD(P)-dependent oxidoreductase [Candidatus Thermoplasmatota archaeon]
MTEASPTKQQDRRIGKALVTGATGGIGRALVNRLVAEGVQVRAIARNPEKARALPEGVEVVPGDLTSPADVRAAVEGVDTVFHLAAWMNKPFSREAAEAVNVTASEYLLHAARRAGVQRFVHVSSVAVYGPVLSGTIGEDAPYWKVDDLYSDTKGEADRLALEFARDTGMEVVVVRPSMVYGPHIEPWTLMPVRSIRSGSPLIIGSGEALVNPIYVENVVDGLLLAATRAGVAGEAFNLSDGVTVTWNEFFGHYGRMLGRGVKKVPQAIAENGAALAAAASRLIKQPPRASREMVGVMTGSPLFSIEKARERLGFEPRINLEEGMRLTERWLEENGHLAGRAPTPQPGAPAEARPVVLLTGAASGMGRATALRLHANGWRVVAGDIDEAGLGSLAEVGIETLALDVTRQGTIDAAAARLREIGRVDALLNVAGIANPGPLETQPITAIEKQFEVNALGALRLARAVLPLMRERRSGRIINVSSTNGRVVSPFMGAYSASKFALEALSDALRLETAPFGIKVVVVQPGSVKTPFADRAKEQLDRAKDASGDYRPYLEAFEKSPMWGQGMTPPEKIAEVLEKALTMPSPPPRIAATRDAVPAMMMARLPDKGRDLLFSTLSGLRKKQAQ